MASEPNESSAATHPTLGFGHTVSVSGNLGDAARAETLPQTAINDSSLHDLITAVEQLLARVKSQDIRRIGPPREGALPLPGYRLIKRLGRGGSGEVWKAEAPGGLFKAIKFVFSDLDEESSEKNSIANQELKALVTVKDIRHPFILSLEQFRVIDGQLIIVMELADRNLWDRFRECRGQGLQGIPREELLRYMLETAEALDLMNNHYQIQHLDVKPQNLFLVFNHIKVADFGLAKLLEGVRATVTGGITPVYAAPETFEGWVSRFSDQYSLAIVFQELLTGFRPFNGANTRQLLMQHINGTPDLSALPMYDRAVIGRGLAKKPDDRWPSCTAFVHALQTAVTSTAASYPLPSAMPRSEQSPAGEMLVARAKRILSNGAETSDYLATPPEVTTQVDREISDIIKSSGVEIPPETRQWMIDNYALQLAYSGREIACWRTGKGVVVFAVGADEVRTFLQQIPGDQRPDVAIEYP